MVFLAADPKKEMSVREHKRFSGLSGVLNIVPAWMWTAGVVLVAGASLAFGQEGNAAGEADAEMSFLELLAKGGWFMVPIGLCSLLGLAIIIERLISLRSKKIIPPGFMAGLKSVFRHDEKDREAGLQYCHASNSPIAHVVAAGIRKIHKSDEIVEKAIEDAGVNEVGKLRHNLRLLYAVSAVAPMLGLLGTVWGMIDAFQQASAKGLGKAQHLATGIYEALVTTFAGLCVAIPVLIFYYFFLGKIDTFVHEMNDQSVEFLDHYAEDI
jgi:biopolymer transport protein ExbB